MAGDFRGAAGVLRPLVTTSALSEPAVAWLMATVFDRAGEREIADRVDEASRGDGREFHGGNLADVRTARRHATDDRARPRQLAGKVLSAWSTADRLPPVLREMRELARR